MARKVTVTLTDDTDPTQEAEETIAFGFDGKFLEIDLSAKNAARFRKDMEKWVPYARKDSSMNGVAKRRAPKTRTVGDRNKSQLIREWAPSKNIVLNSRGRIPQDVIDQYESELAAQS